MSKLTLGNIELWRPPRVTYELTGSRNNYTKNACGATLDSTDLTYKLYISRSCSLAESQEIQLDIEDELKLAPNLSLTRQETPDALIMRNKVQSGSLDYSSDLTELRARFTQNRTLAFQLQLTILPTGASGTGDAAFLYMRSLAATGAFNWPAMSVGAMLFTEGSTAPEELYIGLMNGFVDLKEATNAGYARQAISGKSVVVGSRVQLLMNDPSFGMSAGASDITGMILFKDNGSDATNVPLFLISFEPFNPDGGAHIVHTDLLGLF